MITIFLHYLDSIQNRTLVNLINTLDGGNGRVQALHFFHFIQIPQNILLAVHDIFLLLDVNIIVLSSMSGMYKWNLNLRRG